MIRQMNADGSREGLRAESPDSVTHDQWEHRVFLSDGTVLTQTQWDELMNVGKLVLADGHTITAGAEYRHREKLYANDVFSSFREKR